MGLRRMKHFLLDSRARCPAMPSLLDELDLDVDNGYLPTTENEEDMPLSPENQDWVKVQIAQAVADLQPNGFRRVMYWLKEWGAISALWGVPLALIAVVITLGNFTTSRITKEATFETQTGNDLKTIDKHLTAIDAHLQRLDNTIATSQLTALSGQPITKDSLAAIQQLVLTASSENIKLDQSEVGKAGVRLVLATKNTPDAWPATTVLLGYTSMLNQYWVPADSQQIGTPNFASWYSRPAGWEGSLTAVGQGMPPNVADLRQIGLQDANTGQRTGPSYLVMAGGTVHLDGMIMKRVVVRNATVVYDGGKVSMQKVYFVNCKFQIKHEKPGLLLATEIFSDPSVSFAS